MRSDLHEIAETQRGRRTIAVGEQVKCRPVVGPAFVATVRRIMAEVETEAVGIRVQSGGLLILNRMTPGQEQALR